MGERQGTERDSGVLVLKRGTRFRKYAWTPNFEHAPAAVLQHEGGFVDHPDDPGGLTNRGATLTVLQSTYLGRRR